MATVVRASLPRVGAAYLATQFNNIMDILQLVFAFVNAPLFATFLLGMFWKRATGHGAFFGLLAGTAGRRGPPRPDAARGRASSASRAAGWRRRCTPTRARWRRTSGPRSGPSDVCFVVTIAISLVTRPHEDATTSCAGLVYALTPRPKEEHLPWWKTPEGMGALVLALAVRAERDLLVAGGSHGTRHPHADRPDVRDRSALLLAGYGLAPSGSDIYQRSLGHQRQPLAGAWCCSRSAVSCCGCRAGAAASREGCQF